MARTRFDDPDNMKPAVELKIIPATIEDKKSFFCFMKKFFFPEAPLNSSVNRWPENSEEISVLDTLSNGISFKAIDQSENILGIVINIERKPFTEEEQQESLKKSKNPTALAKIVKALEILERRSDFWNRAKVDKAFHTEYLATNTEYRGLNIGKKLLERSLECAKSHKFEFATIECSSFYSAKIATDLGYEPYFELLYKDYVDEKNNIIFDVKRPHTGLKFCVKKLQ